MTPSKQSVEERPRVIFLDQVGNRCEVEVADEAAKQALLAWVEHLNEGTRKRNETVEALVSALRAAIEELGTSHDDECPDAAHAGQPCDCGVGAVIDQCRAALQAASVSPKEKAIK